MTVVGDGLQTRDYTNVDDVVEANILAATSENKDILGEIFNIGCGKRYSVIDIVDMLRPAYLKYIPARLGESRDTLADISKANKLLKWYPKVELLDWIKKYKIELGI